MRAILGPVKAIASRLQAAVQEGLGAWLRPRPAEPAQEADSTLVLSVSDVGWRGTLLHADGRAPEELGDSGAGLEDTNGSPGTILQRAVRSLSAVQRAEIGQVRLLVSDPSVVLADNRSTRIRGTAADTLAEAGAHLLGSTGAVGGFQLFGHSSEGETPRGVHAFAPADRASQWLGALDTLAVKLVELVPSDALVLDAGGPEPFLAVDVRRDGTTAILADPATGAVAVRRLSTGVLGLAEALGNVTSVSLKEALAGLARRNCLPEPGMARATATSRALESLLASLQAGVEELMDYFVFQRLASAPERVVVLGEAGRVRGLQEWLGTALQLPAVAGPDFHDSLLRGLAPTPGTGEALRRVNMLDVFPKGLLRIGRVEYRFSGGRFRPEQADAGRPEAGAAKGLLHRRITWQSLLPRRVAPALKLDAGRLLPPGLAALGLCASLWFAAFGTSDATGPAADDLAAAWADDAAARASLAAAAHGPRPDASADALFWTDKLLAVAAALPPTLWLTRVSATPEKAAGSGNNQKLVLEGGVAAEPGDPVGQVADLIARLSGNAAFMRGVDHLGLDGVTAEQGGVRFTVSVTLAPHAASAVRLAKVGAR